MLIYQEAVSLSSFKLRLALLLKRFSPDFSEPPGGSYRSLDYRAINPAGTVPALVDGAFWLSESEAIIEYLEDIGAGSSLFPADLRQRARMRMLSRWNDLGLEPAVRRLFAQVAPNTRDPVLLKAIDAQISDKLGLIETGIDEIGAFAAGAAPTVADCGFMASLIWLEALAEPLGLTSTAGNRLARVRQAMAAHPLVCGEIAAHQALGVVWTEGRLKT